MNCPTCDAVIYSRRSGLCGVCGAKLPETVLFGSEQLVKLGEQMEQMKAEQRIETASQGRLLNKDIGNYLG